MKANEKEAELKEKSKKISIIEGSAYSVSDGFGFRNITPYALALGASNVVIGLLDSVPSLIGNLSQLFTNRLMERYSRKTIVVFSVFSQAITWLLVLLPGVFYFIFDFNSALSSGMLIAVYTLLVLSGAIAGPAWQSWMKDLVTSNIGTYFGRRNKICEFVGLIAMLTAGFILDYFKQTKIFIGFFILFFFSFLFRNISGYMFTKKYEPKFKIMKEHYFSFFQFIKKMPSNNFGRFVIFDLLISFSTAIAAPFFAVYMLREKGLSYFFYMLILICSSLSGLASMTLWGKFADNFGNRRVMKIAGLFIFLIPLFYALSFPFGGTGLFVFVAALESFSGFIWAGFNLASSNFVYDAVSRERMALCASYSTVLISAGTFLGAALGGFIASFNFIFPSLLIVFTLSAGLRMAAYLLMINRFREVRAVKDFSAKQFLIHFNLRSSKPIEAA